MVRSKTVMTALARDRRRRAIVRQALVAAVLIGLITAIMVSLNPKRDNGGEAQAERPAAVVVPDVATADGAIRLGNATAPVIVTVYEDLQCPICKTMETRLGSTFTELIDSGAVAVDYRITGFLDAYSKNEYSSRSAAAGWAVAQWDLANWPRWHRTMFDDQPQESTAGPTDQEIADRTAQLGLTAPGISADILAGTYRGYVRSQVDRLVAAGINSVPQVLVNGSKLDDFSPAALRTAVSDAQRQTP